MINKLITYDLTNNIDGVAVSKVETNKFPGYTH